MDTVIAPPRDEDDVAQRPQDALKALLESAGYALFLQHVRAEWGSRAIEAKIRAALEGHPPSEHSMLVQSTIATADAIRRLFAWPEEEVGRLMQQAQQPAAPVDRFAQHRRVGA